VLGGYPLLNISIDTRIGSLKKIKNHISFILVLDVYLKKNHISFGTTSIGGFSKLPYQLFPTKNQQKVDFWLI
jgi:hypothetical protein